MSGTFDKAKDTADEIVHRTEKTVHDVTKRAGRAASDVRDRASDMMGDVDLRTAHLALERRTRANQVLALLVAGAVGVIIGRLFFPRRS